MTLRELVCEAEKNIAQVAAGKYRCGCHLLPPVGWMNDPNGLCYWKGMYHVFFQYAPCAADGSGMRGWGHYVSRDLLSWEYCGVAVYPDTPFDADGAYSGSAVAEGEILSLYYTGNVKHKDRAYDYISDGRESNTILVQTRDGFSFGEKKVLLRTSDYPKEFTRHIRDPKVQKTPFGYEMVLGGRLRGDRGAALVYTSENGMDFSLREVISPREKFGYMWECPDLFTLGKERFLCVSPQGVPHEKYRFQSTYSSGYFSGGVCAENFREWDCGFDFYAPQTFSDGARRILIGWAGMPDVPYDNLPAVREGWQHALTFPRELTNRGGILYQTPVRELEELRGAEIPLWQDCDRYELVLEDILPGTKLLLSDALEISFGEECEFRFVSAAGRGRDVRRADVRVKNARLFMDVSLCEVYLNGGEKVFTSRLYPQKNTVVLTGSCRAVRYALLCRPVRYRKKEEENDV